MNSITRFDFALLSLMTALMLGIYFWTMMLVGAARRQHAVKAPATEGPDAFNRTYRAHVNTLEQLVLSLPAFWLFGMMLRPWYAAVLMAVWCVARVLYVFGYRAEAGKRSTGFMLATGATLAALAGIVLVALQWLWLGR